MKSVTTGLLVTLLALLVACEKPLDQTLADLGSSDERARHQAIERLGKEGEPYLAQLAANLSSDDATLRDSSFEVMRRLGNKALPTMLEKIGEVWKGREWRDGFVEYFRSLGDIGYNALLGQLVEAGALSDGEAAGLGSMGKIEQLYHRFESLSLVAEGLENQLDVGKLPEMLRHTDVKFRTRTAYLLCLKQWKPRQAEEAILFYTHLIATLPCAGVPEPMDEAARLAAANLPAFLKVDDQFPAGGNARWRVLTKTGSDPAAAYVYEQARQTDNEFLLLTYFQTLKEMQTEAAQNYAKRLLADPKAGKSIRALEPRAAEGL